MLEIDHRNVDALALMGVTFHLMGWIESAIVKYHAVRLFRQYLLLTL